jgi:AraC-like DNA-binding protein/quercetin dioxygenase-like cupin family protein
MSAKLANIPILDRPPSQLYFRHEDFEPGSCTPPHTHAWGQLNFVSEGLMQLEVAGQRFLSPSHYAVWIPPHVQHSSYNAHATTYRSVYVSLAFSKRLPADPCTLTLSPILRTILADFAARDVKEPSTIQDQRLARVVMDQLQAAQVHEAYLPYATSDELRMILDILQDNPGDNRSIIQLAAHAKTTARTVERRSQLELGMTLGEWRQRLRFLRAIDALEKGHTVQQIAFDLGYSTPSAFIVMFRRMGGVNPNQYRLDQLRKHESHNNK